MDSFELKSPYFCLTKIRNHSKPETATSIQNRRPRPAPLRKKWRPKVERKEEKKDWIIEDFNKSNEELIWTIPENEPEGGNRM